MPDAGGADAAGSAGAVSGNSEPPGGAPGIAGAPEVGVGAKIELPPERCAFASSASEIDVAMKIAAKITVVRDSAFAAPRPDIRPPMPPPPPRPKAPPSERCSKITPIIATATRK